MPLPGLAGMPPQAVQQAGGSVYITPANAFDNHVGVPFYGQANFTLHSLVGVPSAYDWSIVSGDGFVFAGQGTAVATIQTDGACVIQCTATIGGGDYNPQAAFVYEPGEFGE